jgi:hypothetical protein
MHRKSRGMRRKTRAKRPGTADFRGYGLAGHPARRAAVFLAAAGICALFCAGFRTGVLYFLLAAAAVETQVPSLLYLHCRRLYETRRFQEVRAYMEQMEYSFLENGKLLSAWKETYAAMPEGPMGHQLREVLDTVLSANTPGRPERYACRQIEENYGCPELTRMHDFLLNAEEIGGDMRESIRILLKEGEQWEKRVQHHRKEQLRYLRDVVIAICLSAGICMAALAMLPGETQIWTHPLVRATDLALIFLDVRILRRTMAAVSGSLLKQKETQREMLHRYERCQSWTAEKERKNSFVFTAVPAAGMAAARAAHLESLIPLLAAAAVLTLFQHRIRHALDRKRVHAEMCRAFPEWLMQMGLLLQSENVHMSITRSLDQAPLILQPELKKLLLGMNRSPESQKPYQDFLKDYEVREAAPAMRMLYAVASGSGGNPSDQIAALVEKNMDLYDQARRESDADRLAGLYTMFLIPSVTGMLKLAADMTMFMLTYFGTLARLGS